MSPEMRPKSFGTLTRETGPWGLFLERPETLRTRKVFGAVFGSDFGLRKVFLKTPERNPRFSGMFFRECPTASA